MSKYAEEYMSYAIPFSQGKYIIEGYDTNLVSAFGDSRILKPNLVTPYSGLYDIVIPAAGRVYDDVSIKMKAIVTTSNDKKHIYEDQSSMKNRSKNIIFESIYLKKGEIITNVEITGDSRFYTSMDAVLLLANTRNNQIEHSNGGNIPFYYIGDLAVSSSRVQDAEFTPYISTIKGKALLKIGAAQRASGVFNVNVNGVLKGTILTKAETAERGSLILDLSIGDIVSIKYSTTVKKMLASAYIEISDKPEFYKNN